MVKKRILVKMDTFGKIFLPKQVRSQMKAKQFEVVMVNDELHLVPVEHPANLFGTLPETCRKSLEDLHDEEHDFP